LNIFGYVDDGPAARRIDLHLFNSMHTMWRHWTLRGRPPVESYLDRHRTIYNPVTLHAEPVRLSELRARGRARLGIPPDGFVVGDVCRPDPRKLDYMLAAIAPRLDREVGGLHVVTQRFPDGVAAALRRVLGDRYHNLPFAVDRDALLETYAAMDVFAHFSTMGESFGMAVAEAMRCGLPVVANETPGAKQNNAQPELIEEGRTGFFANDPYTAVRRLAELAADGALRRRLGEAGARRFTVPPLAPASIARQLEAEIARLAAAKGLGPAPVAYERLPSRAEEAAYLASYRPRRMAPPLPAPAADRPWRLAADARRLTWRVVRRRISE
jgi:glycosyltransferase involved in cell wall biosynthesis